MLGYCILLTGTGISKVRTQASHGRRLAVEHSVRFSLTATTGLETSRRKEFLSDPKAEIDPTEPGYPGAFRLDGQAALITTGPGSERGIGREIGLAYAAADASVGLADVDEDSVGAAARVVQAAGGEAMPLHMDATDLGSVSAAVAAFDRELGPVDILVLASDAAAYVTGEILVVNGGSYFD